MISSSYLPQSQVIHAIVQHPLSFVGLFLSLRASQPGAPDSNLRVTSFLCTDFILPLRKQWWCEVSRRLNGVVYIMITRLRAWFQVL
jgi:hypothetical protein